MTSAEEWLRDRVARSRGARRRPQRRRQGRLRRGCVAGRRGARRDQAAQEQLGAGDAGRPSPRKLATRRAALPAFRRLRRLQDAASRRRRAGGDEAACPRRRALASRQGPPRARAAADRRAGLELPTAGASVGAPRRQEGHGAGRLPRAQVELRRRDQELRRGAAPRQRPDHAAARADRSDVSARPVAADRARGRRRRSPRWSCATSSRWSTPTSRCCASSRIVMASNGGCSRKDPRPRIGSTARLRCSLIGCPNSAFDAVPPTDFTQVNHQINEALVRARCACSRRRRTTS